MLRELRLFLTAIQFFTRIPVPAWVGHSAQQLELAARYLTLVGAVVGTIAGAALWLSTKVLPLPLAVGLSMVAGIFVTGAFHEDGLSDFADGMGGGHSKEMALAIMKDSRIGAYGAIALVLVLLLKYQALLALCGRHTLLFVAAALVAAHSTSRMIAASLMFTQRYVREDNSARAKHAAQEMSPASFAIALFTAASMLALLYVAGARIIAVLTATGAALLVRAYLAWWLQKKLGGYTGDCLGAVQQLSELAFYLGLLAVF